MLASKARLSYEHRLVEILDIEVLMNVEYDRRTVEYMLGSLMECPLPKPPASTKERCRMPTVVIPLTAQTLYLCWSNFFYTAPLGAEVGNDSCNAA